MANIHDEYRANIDKICDEYKTTLFITLGIIIPFFIGLGYIYSISNLLSGGAIFFAVGILFAFSNSLLYGRVFYKKHIQLIIYPFLFFPLCSLIPILFLFFAIRFITLNILGLLIAPTVAAIIGELIGYYKMKT